MLCCAVHLGLLAFPAVPCCAARCCCSAPRCAITQKSATPFVTNANFGFALGFFAYSCTNSACRCFGGTAVFASPEEAIVIKLTANVAIKVLRIIVSSNKQLFRH
jgi:hypothetical protein